VAAAIGLDTVDVAGTDVMTGAGMVTGAGGGGVVVVAGFGFEARTGAGALEGV
jgi:hypothetical protein